MELIMSFEKNDKELIKAIQEQFGNNIKYEESKGFDGLEILLTAIVPITSLTIEIIDFILANFCNKDKDEDIDSIDKKRVIVESGGNIDLKGYNEEEACKIIECYFKNQNDNRK